MHAYCDSSSGMYRQHTYHSSGPNIKRHTWQEPGQPGRSDHEKKAKKALQNHAHGSPNAAAAQAATPPPLQPSKKDRRRPGSWVLVLVRRAAKAKAKARARYKCMQAHGVERTLL